MKLVVSWISPNIKLFFYGCVTLVLFDWLFITLVTLLGVIGLDTFVSFAFIGNGIVTSVILGWTFVILVILGWLFVTFVILFGVNELDILVSFPF